MSPPSGPNAKPPLRNLKKDDDNAAEFNHGAKLKDRLLTGGAKPAGSAPTGGCPAQAAAGHTLCGNHLQVMSRRHKQRYRERAGEALCIYCGERPRFWGVRCIICRQRYGKNPLPFGARRALRLYREAETRYEAEQIQVEARRVVRQLLASGDIKGRRARALALYAGINDGKWRTYADVGEIMNLSKEGVRQLLLPSKIVLTGLLGDKVPWKTGGNDNN